MSVNELSQRNVLILDAVHRLLRRGAVRNLTKMVNKMYPVEVAKALRHLDDPSEKRIVFGLVAGAERRAGVISELDPNSAVAVFTELTRAEQIDILHGLDTDDAADLMGLLPADMATYLLEEMSEEHSGGVADLMGYPAETAGGIMTPQFLAFPEDTDAQTVISYLQEHAADAEMVFYLYVVDAGGVLKGVLSLRDLLTVPPSARLGDIMHAPVIKAGVFMDQEAVARLTARYNLLAVPVVDPDERLVGIITVDDVIDVIREEATEDMLKMSGTGGEGQYILSVGSLRAYRLRMPWLLVNVAGGIAGAALLTHFSGTLEAMLVLAAFIPVSMALGGSLGLQSSTIVVRGLATGAIEPSDVRRVFLRELRVGALVGLTCGALVGGVALLWHNPWLGAVVGLSLFSASCVAVITGTLAPVLFQRLRIDPAISSGPLVTTINDLTGLIIYLGMATLMLVRHGAPPAP